MDAKHTPGPWRWEYNASSKSVSIVGGATRYETVMDFARWGMGRAAPMFSEAVTDPQGWHIITRLPDRPDWVAPIPGREHHKDWCMTVIHPDAVLMARAPELLAETTRLLAEVEALRADAEKHRIARPLSEWHEDMGAVLWWLPPIDEPPYCGQPGDSDWPGYHTHWTPIVVPANAAQGGKT